MQKVIKQALTNHVAIVVDESSSMSYHRKAVIAAVDSQVASLVESSKRMNQETRISVYAFSNTVKCLVWDMDVLRFPSIAEHYHPNGMTALVDASVAALDDLGKIPEVHSDHAFLAVVITDGQENASQSTPSALARRLGSIGDNWTVATLVPDYRGEEYAKRCGFPPGNIMTWDATSAAGFEQAAQTISRATDQFMVARSKGIRSSQAVFSMGAETVNAQSIQQAGLTPLSPKDYMLVPVTKASPIKAWVEEECGRRYQLGRCFYEMSKRETVQTQKQLAVVEKATGRVFAGDGVRDMVGLGGNTVRVSPDHNDKYKLFVQSTSVNRKLVPGTQLLLLT